MFEKLKEIFPEWQSFSWWMYPVFASLVLILGVFIYTMIPKSSVDVSAQETKEIETLEKLILLQAELASLQEKLAAKQVADVRPRPKAQSQKPILGFTGGGEFQNIQNKKSDPYIPRGSIFKAQTLTSIKTSIAASFVVAQTTQRFEMDSKRFIPKGTRLIGSAQLNALQGVQVRFDTLVLPSGKQIDGVNLIALDSRAFPELNGIYFSNKDSVYGAGLAFGFLSGFAGGAQDREATIAGSVATPSLKNQMLGGLSSASFAVAESLLKDIQNHSIEYVVVPAGEEIFIAVNGKLQMNHEGL